MTPRTPAISYAAASVEVRDDIRAAHARFFERLASPGTWFSGSERVAIASEARAADACAYCRGRKKALSPYALQGEHDAMGLLPSATVEVIHRIRTDPGRLGRRFYDEALASGLSDAQYVEIVGIVAQLTAIDSFCKAVGVPLHPLPAPLPGAPSRRRPAGAKPGDAWVPWIEPADASGPEADLYGGNPNAGNVNKAMSLVPDEVRGMRDLGGVQYVPMDKVFDVSFRRSLTRAQIELIAGRVSALNECFY